jgi:hypothetical protein
MFYIKVYLPHSMDYEVYSAKEYRIESMAESGQSEGFVKSIILDHTSDEEVHRVVSLSDGKSAYVMNSDGKTIDTIRVTKIFGTGGIGQTDR